MCWGKDFAWQLASDVHSHVKVVDSAVMSTNNPNKSFENLTGQLFAKLTGAIKSARAALGIGESIQCKVYDNSEKKRSVQSPQEADSSMEVQAVFVDIPTLCDQDDTLP